MIAAEVSRTDDANVRTAVVSRGATAVESVGYAEDLTDVDGDADMELAPPSSVGPRSLRGEKSRPCSSEATLADQNERARLIGDISRLIREPTVPENTRIAGLTLIGWLARRRPDEPPHAIGVTEARASEQRVRTARNKSR